MIQWYSIICKFRYQHCRLKPCLLCLADYGRAPGLHRFTRPFLPAYQRHLQMRLYIQGVGNLCTTKTDTTERWGNKGKSQGTSMTLLNSWVAYQTLSRLWNTFGGDINPEKECSGSKSRSINHQICKGLVTASISVFRTFQLTSPRTLLINSPSKSKLWILSSTVCKLVPCFSSLRM